MNNFLTVAKVYRNSPRGLIYIPLRYLIIPFIEIDKNVPKKGTVIDLGSGEGIIATYLAHTSTKRNVIGWDTNLKRINLANKSASKSPNLKFEAKNALSRMPKVDAVILSDFIHHVPKKFHQKLFTNIYSSLKKGGVMVIKEINTQDLVRAKISRIFDFAFYPKDKIFFLNAQHLTSDLEKIGFKVKRQKVKKLFPGSTNLFICTK